MFVVYLDDIYFDDDGETLIPPTSEVYFDTLDQALVFTEDCSVCHLDLIV